jgi:hypothetical protein
MEKLATSKVEVAARVAEGEKLKKIKVDGIEHLVRAEDLALEKLIADGCRLTREIEELEERLKELKARALEIARQKGLLQEKKSAKLVGLAGVAEVSVRQELKILDPQALRQALGTRYPLCVTEEVAYKPQKPLREILADADHPQADVLRAAVAVRETEHVRFVPREG